ncbi:uncharacterized protein BDZ99DRAFT_126213 [Mytilinidion resinicola]|uniref:Uncharacterized protein n=1 Tax=Mytilinidion resinicola TaxID=574789 RepID=A0A6A6Z6T3_9PEZI|nr:uncharacterized protein BDZ99DRAFT_126213 [Mytilinidion resinicola]KAF2815945.1 hypothetical protein BDZ99DRAFT_126213 [Mytilinidion resinicola]
MSYQSHSTKDFDHRFNATLAAIVTNKTATAQLEVRIGYFGLCVSKDPSAKRVCAEGRGAFRDRIGTAEDPLSLLGIMDHFKNDVLFPGLILTSLPSSIITFCGLARVHSHWDDNPLQSSEHRPRIDQSWIYRISVWLLLVSVIVSSLCFAYGGVVAAYGSSSA